MDWANEEYVRIYVRDTRDILALDHEERGLWWDLIRKADKSGVVDADMDTLPALIRTPADVVERCLPKLMRRGMVTKRDTYFFIPNHVDAQTASKTDKQRQRESRARREALARVGELGGDVTNRDGMSRAVTDGHDLSLVTDTAAMRCGADAEPDVTADKPPRERRRATALPADWTPNESHRALAVERRADLDYELAQFRDHAEANGRTQKNWDAAFRTWLRRAKPAQRPLVNGSSKRAF